MITSVMVMMTVEMGVMRQTALVSVILQHRFSVKLMGRAFH
jgi:hypothetical protein